MQREVAVEALRYLLQAQPAQDKRQLLAGLRAQGLHGLTTTDVNSLLYAERDLFASDGGTPPRWRVVSQAGGRSCTQVSVQLAPEQPRSYAGHPPRAWQQ